MGGMHLHVRLLMIAYVIVAGTASTLLGSLVAALLTGWASILTWAAVSAMLTTVAVLRCPDFLLAPKKDEPAIPAPDGYHFGEDHEWGPEDQRGLVEWVKMLRREIEDK